MVSGNTALGLLTVHASIHEHKSIRKVVINLNPLYHGSGWFDGHEGSCHSLNDTKPRGATRETRLCRLGVSQGWLLCHIVAPGYRCERIADRYLQ